MRIIRSSGKDFRDVFDRIRNRGGVFDDRLEKTVRGILEDVRRRGDAALVEYAWRFDGVSLGAGKLEVPGTEVGKALERLNPGTVKVLKLAARSSAVLRALRNAGGYEHVRFVNGGMSEWARRGWPMVKPGG